MSSSGLGSTAEALVPYGWNAGVRRRLLALQGPADSYGDHGPAVGRVVRPDGGHALTVLADGMQTLPVRPRCRPVTVGDWVVVSDGAVTEVLTRSSLLQRRDPSTGNAQLLAANVDIVAIVCGLDRPVKPGRIQRAAALAWDAGAEPVIVLTKSDVPEDPAGAQARVWHDHPAMDVITTSSVTEHGLDRLRELAVGRTLVLLGESGAGKSTLVNTLAGAELAAASAVREGDAKGRHTTTSRYLHRIHTGGCVIDTPGLREIGLWGEESSVRHVFEDIEALARDCRFRDCGHGGEPGCAVDAAVAAGELDVGRLQHYHELRREAASAALRADEHAKRQQGRQFGRMVREAKRLKYTR